MRGSQFITAGVSLALLYEPLGCETPPLSGDLGVR